MPDESTAPTKKKTTIPIVVAVVALIVAAVFALTSPFGDADQDATASAPGAAQPQDGSEATSGRQDPLSLGEPDAPVVLVEYSDFQCPFCGKFARDTEPELIDRYVDDGTLRIEWRDFPYIGSESYMAAHAGRAAALQDKFWEFHDAMYADQPPPNSGQVDEAYLVDVAERIGLDVPRFRKDLFSGDVAAAVAKDFREGLSRGVNGTPAFFLNGQMIVGAQPLDVFVRAIEQAAAKAR